MTLNRRLSAFLTPRRCVRILELDSAATNNRSGIVRVCVYSFLVWAVTSLPTLVGIVPSSYVVPMSVLCLVGLWFSPWTNIFAAASFVTRRMRRGVYSEDLDSVSWAISGMVAVLYSNLPSYRLWSVLSYEHRMVLRSDCLSRDEWLSSLFADLSHLRSSDDLSPDSAPHIESLLKTVFLSSDPALAMDAASSVLGPVSRSRLSSLEVLSAAACLAPAVSASPAAAELLLRLSHSWSGSASDLASAVLAVSPASASSEGDVEHA